MEEQPPGKVLLVGWDGAEWDVIRPLVRDGRLPNLTRLIEQGISGNLRSPHPHHSPMAWTTVATGNRPQKHRVCGHDEIRPDRKDIRPASSHSLRTKALWNIVSQNGRRANCVNWYASHPVGQVSGVCVSRDFFFPLPVESAGAARHSVPPIPGDCTWPPGLATELADLRIGPRELDPAAVLELIPGAATVDQSKDGRVFACAAALAETASVHAVACRILQDHPGDLTAILYTGLESFSHAFMPCRPPRQSHISDHDLTLYGSVLDAAYRLHDMMLGRLMDLVDRDTTIVLVSDHGFKTGMGRRDNVHCMSNDDAVASHDSHGVLVMRGPNIVRDELIEGATLPDMTPTVLAVMGIPFGADMDGRPLTAAFAKPVGHRSVPSWDRVQSTGWPMPPEPVPQIEPELRYLAELGYTEPPTVDARRRIDRVHRENTYNLALSLIEARQTEQAIPMLESLARIQPDHSDLHKTLVQAYLTTGRTADARRIVQRYWDTGQRGPPVRLGFATIELAERNAEAALEHLNFALASGSAIPELHLLIGQAYLRLRRWELAEAAFCTELSLSGNSELAWGGRAAASLGKQDFQTAAEHALQAVGLRPDYAQGHFHLGTALLGLGQFERAAHAFGRCLAIDPDFVAAVRSLVTLYEDRIPHHDLARKWRAALADCMTRRRLRRGSEPVPLMPLPCASAALSV